MYHAYLKLPATSSADKFLINDPSAIEEVVVGEQSRTIYNLNGVRVNEDYKGIVINRGKKYFTR